MFVSVNDQNDECPVFLNGSGVQLFVMENSVSDVVVGQVIATDADEGTNGLVNYLITAGDPGDYFNISLNTGTIVTSTATIDREIVSNFSLTICVSFTPYANKKTAHQQCYHRPWILDLQ